MEILHYLGKEPYWHSRGYIPHFEGGSVPQGITFRLHDSLPVEKLAEWATELDVLPSQEAEKQRWQRIDSYLDRGSGSAWLGRVEIAEIVEQTLNRFDGEKYRLHAWVVMPNHVHLVLTPNLPHSVSEIVHSLKSYTVKQANIRLGRKGKFWQEDYFDRYIRNQRHFENVILYIEHNPVKAGLCANPESWPFSSAARRKSINT